METSKKILALDSSGLVASVAVVEGNSTYSNLLAEYTVNYKKTHSQTCHGKGSGTGIEKTVDLHSYSGCSGIQSLRDGPVDLPNHGCQKKSGVYRHL